MEEQTWAAKGQMVALMQAGHSWQEASAMAGVQISRSAAYRLVQKVRAQGEAALQDGRHGQSEECIAHLFETYGYRVIRERIFQEVQANGVVTRNLPGFSLRVALP